MLVLSALDAPLRSYTQQAKLVVGGAEIVLNSYREN